MKVTLYGKDGCPKCFYCETKMKQMADIELKVHHDEDSAKRIVDEKGLETELPILVVGDKIYQSSDAVDWVRNR